MMEINEYIHRSLLALQDQKYRDFYIKLLPTLSTEKIIGVRMPALRKLSKELKNRNDLVSFLEALPHAYYEENNLHAILIGKMEYMQCISALNHFLPYVDNWATCDSLRPKCFGDHLDALIKEIERWLNSGESYTIRFAIEMLMIWYLEKEFKPEYLQWVASVNRDNYYVKMMQAWYFATALQKQHDLSLKYFLKHRLDVWVHNKAIQKALESNCISDEQKDYLRILRRK